MSDYPSQSIQNKEETKNPAKPRGKRKAKRKTTGSSFGTRFFRAIVVCWLSFLTYWIFYDEISPYHPSFTQYKQKIQTDEGHPLPPPTNIHTPNQDSNIATKETENSESSTPTPTATLNRNYPTIYLLRTREGPGLTNLQTYLQSVLEEPIPVVTLEYNSQEKEFYSSGHLVSAEQLQKSITLFVFHLTTPKITGTWDIDLHTAIFIKSHGNCVWTSIKSAQPSEIAEHPVKPEEVRSGVNLFADSNQMEKVLQFHISQMDFLDDSHNRINCDKLRKIVKAKEDSLNS